ncbi:helix-turn-helix transcriptional regulator [Herbiconiux sp. CPCC 205716]|uniref:Helix-turn-helix transcriptional regulator n=1 Tax=Herbiconiux gentiana TaxID=2970912 RepID=A0ABT2GC02_9MICO|nr:helix-turn-helix transcriptional regulator [Herbiconiux gentiana]MCS5713741.1 helix-turn-helix transcriptional regulator [Herbiconiux gentiana]
MSADPRAAALSDFLRSRRGQLDPGALGLPGGARRVPGLKREEVAALAGISRDYYVRLEQGRGHQMSEQVVASLARALQLDGDERSYFHRLASPHPASITADVPQPVTATVLALLDQWADVPAYVFDGNEDILAINEMADLVSPGLEWFGDNIVLGAFAVVEMFPDNPDFQEHARRSTAALRFHGDPENERHREIVGQLSVGHVLFRRLWAEHHAYPFISGTVPVSVNGSELVDFPWQILEIPGGFFMAFMPVEVGSTPWRMLAWLRETKLTGRGLRGPMAGWPALS